MVKIVEEFVGGSCMADGLKITRDRYWYSSP